MDDPRTLAFFDGPLVLGDLTLRPLSLMTLVLSEHFDLTIVLSGGRADGLSKEELDAQLAVFVWMQTTPTDEVLQSARDGTWQAFRLASFSEDLSLAALLLLELRRHRETIEAARFRVMGGDTKSGGTFHPSWIARAVHLATMHRGWSERFVLWHLPYTRLLQYEHCALRGLGWRTAHPEAPGSAAQQLAALETAAAAAAPEPEDW